LFCLLLLKALCLALHRKLLLLRFTLRRVLLLLRLVSPLHFSVL
jgi:hypothetical protein